MMIQAVGVNGRFHESCLHITVCELVTITYIVSSKCCSFVNFFAVQCNFTCVLTAVNLVSANKARAHTYTQLTLVLRLVAILFFLTTYVRLSRV